MTAMTLLARLGRGRLGHVRAETVVVPRGLVETAIVLAGLDLLVPVRGLWVVQLLVLGTLLTFPGFLVLRANRMTTSEIARSPGWLVSASLVLLTFVGLAVDLLGPLVGLDHPLRPVPLLVALNVVCLALAALSRPTSLVESLAAARDGIDRRATTALFVPGLAAVGALRLNNGHGSVLAVAGAVAGVALVALGVWRSGRWQPQRLAWCLYSGTLALLLGYSLRSDYVFGWDVSAEYNLLHRTIVDGHWTAAHPGDAYGAMLSLTVLPTFISALTGLSGLVILKLAYPVLFALTPIVAVALLRRVLGPRAAFLGGALLLTQASFMREMPALARQEIALLLFSSMLAALMDDGLPRARRVRLTLLLVAGVTVSHYSTTYTLASVLLGAVVVQWVSGRFHGLPSLNVRLFAVLVVTIGLGFFWYQGVTESTGHTEQTVSQLLQSGLQVLPSGEGESRLHAYLRGPAPPAPLTVQDYEAKVAAEYARDKPWVVLSPNAGDAAFALREAPVPGPKQHLLLPLTDLGSLIFSQLLVLCTVIGTVSLVLRRTTTGRLNDFAIMAVSCVGLLGAARLSSAIAETYGQDRLYIQLMPIIAVPVLWLLATGWRAVESGGTRLRRRTPRAIRHTPSRQVAIGLVGVAVVAMTAISAGLAETAVGDKSEPNFYNAGEHFDRFYVTAPEVAGAEWLSSVQPARALTYTDVYGQLRLFGYGDVRGVVLTDVTPLTVDQNSWVYGTHENVVERVARGSIEGQTIHYRWPADYLRSQLGVVYTNGISEVFHR